MPRVSVVDEHPEISLVAAGTTIQFPGISGPRYAGISPCAAASS